MSTTTTNYNLVKPEYSDDADIADINGNMDIIDSQMKTNADAIATNATAIATKQNSTDNALTTTDKTIVGAINELKGAIVVEQKSSSSFTPSGSNVSINIAKTGYTPIGIVGITGQNTSIMTFFEWYIESSTNAKVYYRASSTSYSVTLTLSVLYVKN